HITLIQGKSLASKTEISQADITFSDLTFFRISDKKERNRDMLNICLASTYATAIHMPHICLY
ncbi:hypothetical protein ACVRME_004597, partial [Salmonella enterica subsp. enterica serovar Infantis]